MPTFERSDSFKSDYGRLSEPERATVKRALREFIEDLSGIERGTQTQFRATLRVKPMKGHDGIWEMTWEYQDGRATFMYGPPRDAENAPQKRHVQWRRIGTHRIFTDPEGH